MRESEAIILRFLQLLADVRKTFLDVELFAERSEALRSVSVLVNPFKANPSEYANGGVTISMELDAELTNPLDADRKAIGMSLLLRHSREVWIAEAEVGWIGQNIGWNQFDEREVQSDTIEEMIQKVPSLVEWMDGRFKEEVTSLTQ